MSRRNNAVTSRCHPVYKNSSVVAKVKRKVYMYIRGFSSKYMALVVSLCITSAAPAEMIRLIYDGFIEGTLAGAPLPLSRFHFEATANTEDRQGGPINFNVVHQSQSPLAIEGIGEIELLVGTGTWTTRQGFSRQTVGFFRLDGGWTLFQGPNTTELFGWDLASSIGPISSPLGSWQNPMFPIPTSAGELRINTNQHLTTFQAIVPEPATASLFVFAALAAAGALRRRR